MIMNGTSPHREVPFLCPAHGSPAGAVKTPAAGAGNAPVT